MTLMDSGWTEVVLADGADLGKKEGNKRRHWGKVARGVFYVFTSKRRFHLNQ